MTGEKEIENEILRFLKIIGVFCWKQNNVGIFDPIRKVYRRPKSPHIIKGVSDILGIISGRMLAIEVKSKTGRISDEQRIFLAKINQEGGIAFVTRSLPQTIEQLLPCLPNNQHLKEFAKRYLDKETLS